MLNDAIIEIGGVWFRMFGTEDPKIYYSTDRAIWMTYNPDRFNAITGNIDVKKRA